MEKYKKIKTLLELSKINPYLFYIELKSGELVRIVKVIITAFDSAYILLENRTWYHFFPDDQIQVIERPSSNSKTL